MKTVYGSIRTWHEYYWAYCVDNKNRVVLVRCETPEDAAQEQQRMKLGNNFRTVGSVTRKRISELDLLSYTRSRGWKTELIRSR